MAIYGALAPTGALRNLVYTGFDGAGRGHIKGLIPCRKAPCADIPRMVWKLYHREVRSQQGYGPEAETPRQGQRGETPTGTSKALAARADVFMEETPKHPNCQRGLISLMAESPKGDQEGRNPTWKSGL